MGALASGESAANETAAKALADKSNTLIGRIIATSEIVRSAKKREDNGSQRTLG
jgi:hypothetical protein